MMVREKIALLKNEKGLWKVEIRFLEEGPTVFVLTGNKPVKIDVKSDMEIRKEGNKWKMYYNGELIEGEEILVVFPSDVSVDLR